MKRTYAGAISALALAVTVTACSGGSAAKPSVPDSASPSSASSAAPGKDLSGEVMNYRRPADIAKVTTSNTTVFPTPVTIHIVGLKTDAQSTILTYYVTGSFGSQFLFWEDFPTLVDPSTKTSYAVNTYAVPDKVSGGTVQRCACSLPRTSDDPAGGNLSTAQFPPLPASVDKAELTSRWFSAVPVTVSR